MVQQAGGETLRKLVLTTASESVTLISESQKSIALESANTSANHSIG
jgi:hypothetical protein